MPQTNTCPKETVTCPVEVDSVHCSTDMDLPAEYSADNYASDVALDLFIVGAAILSPVNAVY